MRKSCILCSQKHFIWHPYCKDCQKLFALVKDNLGKMGLSQLMDVLLTTGIPKMRIYEFLHADPYQKGSLMDQIVAQLTNNLAEGIGVKGSEMTAEDVKHLRKNQTTQASDKPLDH